MESPEHLAIDALREIRERTMGRVNGPTPRLIKYAGFEFKFASPASGPKSSSTAGKKAPAKKTSVGKPKAGIPGRYRYGRLRVRILRGQRILRRPGISGGGRRRGIGEHRLRHPQPGPRLHLRGLGDRQGGGGPQHRLRGSFGYDPGVHRLECAERHHRGNQ